MNLPPGAGNQPTLEVTSMTAAPAEPAPTDPAPVDPAPTRPADPPAALHDDPVIAKALEGLTPEQRETLLTTGGKNALAARLEETKQAKAVAATAAETARAELAQAIGKTLGLVKDDDPIDPAKLTEELTAEKTAAQQARVELAVFRAAGAANGDPAALLDSTSFLRSLDGIDPNDAAAVQAAITSAVTANPRLGAAPADPRTPAPNPAQGSSAGGAPDLDTQIAAATAAGDTKLAIHLQNQKLAPSRG